jgi:hypothetical protein
MDAVTFPSVQWFERLAARMRDDEPAYRELGAADCALVVQVDRPEGPADLYEVVFAGFGVASVRRLTSLAHAAPSHFVLEGPFDAWREMIENIRAHGRPDLEHTLNSLTLPDVPLRVSGPDQLEVDTFYRYNATLQRFFDGVAAVPTAFAA